ncbi:MAG: type I glyceraldehyde-3-phosphate dehydrogenase [Eggerthellaceae bacterium]|jgi:glyceraldehyde 3-phosphate dehydrogenase
MTTKVGINGFGRIGRMAFRAMFDDPDLEVVAVNDPGTLSSMVHLLKYDSVQGRAFDDVAAGDGCIIVDGKEVKVTSTRVPAEIPWGDLGVDVVVESTGHFRDANDARAHLDQGAKKVVITAPGKNEDKTIVMGVNDDTYDPATDNIVSNASCTTNCLAPIMKVLLKNFGVQRGFMNTIHSYTNDQRILDQNHKDLRRARAAALSQIPTTTGAARAVSLVLPELKGKLEGMSTRVPTPTGSMVYLTCELEQDVTADMVDAAMREASETYLKGYLEFCEDPIVSADVIHNPHSSIYDSLLTKVIGDKSNFVQIIAWYDNEWGYSCRVKDLVKILL